MEWFLPIRKVHVRGLYVIDEERPGEGGTETSEGRSAMVCFERYALKPVTPSMSGDDLHSVAYHLHAGYFE